MDLIKKHLCNSILFFILPVSVFLTFNKHSRSRVDSYKSVIWADAAGYYVYLPLYFIYDNDALKLPERIVERTGNGFAIDTVNNKVITKYTSGVAFLQFPFFAASHVVAKLFNDSPDGFSSVYRYGIMLAAVFYGCLGLWFLCRFLQNYFNTYVSFLTVLAIFLCTNLFYYTIDASGMSHVYSFFLCSALLYYAASYISLLTVKSLFILVLLIVIAALIRPTNILFVSVPLFLNTGNMEELKDRLLLFYMNKKILVFGFLLSCLVLVPQLIYWYNLSGSLFHYSYGSEGFVNWNNPQLLKIWFSTNNGLFLYSPLLLLSVASCFYMISKKEKNGIWVMTIFFAASYLFASWHDWTFGCSFGSRPFVEYYPLFAIPVAFVLSNMKSNYHKVAVYGFIVFCCYLNFDMTYYYDGCFYGGDWDIETYLQLLK
ncbi:MAG: hypothetical protein POELPBGB_03844 [Bacteroidia bacterium]|nr:hypothetical protein [Bacteroidia bacterium]